ncbi:MAG: UDP-N-acetylglucosamine 2-epimerase (hydrolyzing) [Micavibrio aeruginosavorus]|uniref:UDP-N-acetylglucosamine 2-epimerase (Hydrolyzing) n=1 Tax=Micavibrio aeruginosavorus TaxID=349221 RepID=A0A2W5FKN7_9BACT|nr:MAG: UDP-N-acetylglucosamine 2-epimerase (hydrolyzing) [Micavibrio aeruginosavorus]
MEQRNILFLTGTRADFGKLLPLIQAVEAHPDLNCRIFCTGMHQLKLYGNTANEVMKYNFSHVHHYINQRIGEPMEMILANTISGLSRYIEEHPCDMIVVHGDRVEALAGAIVGMIKNVIVSHIEGGERSGTVDEMLRHAVSKLSHYHFVANEEAAARVRQMGEVPEKVYVIGSPDIDVMRSANLPALDTVKEYYEIDFNSYAIAMFHPVTTEQDQMEENAEKFVQALLEDNHNYVVIYPNNDEGTGYILDAYKRLENNERFRIYPSIKFERFLVLLKNAQFCIGNSSAGMREAPFYAIPTVNIGTRQQNRFIHSSIINCGYETNDILDAIASTKTIGRSDVSSYFGKGDSADGFMKAIAAPSFWQTKSQKQFFDIPAALKIIA